MRAYLITYSITEPGYDLIKLNQALESFENARQLMDNTWVVKTDKKASELGRYLVNNVADKDKLVIFRLNGEGAWAGLPETVSDWLEANLS